MQNWVRHVSLLGQVKCFFADFLYLSSEHHTLWMTEMNLPTCVFVSRKEFELYLLSTDLYLRASADRVPLFPGLKTEGLPAKFDWRDKGVVAPVQNQQAV